MKFARHAFCVLAVITSLCASDVRTDLEPNKCAVLSDFLRAEMGKDVYAIRTGNNGSLLLTVTMPFTEKALPKAEREVKVGLKPLNMETWQSFRDCATRSQSIQHNISAPPLTAFLTPQQMKDVDRVLAKRPPSSGYIGFSCVGIDKSETQALFYLSRLRTSNAVGKWVLMERRSRTMPWIQAQDMVVWIA